MKKQQPVQAAACTTALNPRGCFWLTMKLIRPEAGNRTYHKK